MGTADRGLSIPGAGLATEGGGAAGFHAVFVVSIAWGISGPATVTMWCS